MQELEDLHVNYMVIDSSPEAARLPYWGLLMQQLVESHEDRLQLEFRNTRTLATDRRVRSRLYRLKHQSAGPPKPLTVDFSESVQRLLKR